jgi:hypothetical protein
MKNILIGLLVLIVLGGTGVWFYNRTPKESQVACTMEALACPDGSYVGRSGPQCQFSACPGTSFVGTLVKTQNGFVLHTDALKENTQEVVYVLPLSTDKDLSSYVNKKVTVSGAFTQGNIFALKTVEPLTGTASDPTLGEVTVGQSVLINGVRVTLNKVVSDSRCPKDVQCIWAGNVVVEVTLQSNTDKETIQMTSDKAPIAFDSYKVSIVAVASERTVKNLLAKDYIITFRVK